MRVSVDVDDLSAAFEVNISLSSQGRRASKEPHVSTSGGASVAEDGVDSTDDHEYDLPYPEELNWMGHWVVFNCDAPGYYCDYREVQRVTAGVSDANIVEYRDAKSACKAFDAAVAKKQVERYRAQMATRPRNDLTATPRASIRVAVSPNRTSLSPSMSSTPSRTSPSPRTVTPPPPISSSRRPPTASPALLSHRPTPPAPYAIRSARTYPDPYIGPPRDAHNRDHGQSANNKKKCYAVFVGRRPGIYFTWRETLAQISGVKDCAQTGYPTYQEALEAYHAKGRLGEVKVATA